MDLGMVKCNFCRQTKRKIKHRHRKSGRGFHYIDEKGRFWDGRMCPSCKVRKLVVYNRAKRKGMLQQLKDRAEGVESVSPPTRVCRKCMAATHNYFLCKACHTSASEDMWDMSNSYGGLV